MISCDVHQRETKDLEMNWISHTIKILQNFPALI